jgi:hypothetical protein
VNEHQVVEGKVAKNRWRRRRGNSRKRKRRLEKRKRRLCDLVVLLRSHRSGEEACGKPGGKRDVQRNR